ncbi:GNAT family N-acetyltransferase [Herbiconiux sp. KACC 21604]|uniref:GNAT family N-acetyltransferase n=1 Tax=unclassified Herbiconiux TaxID=2618217 RepID=UPI0014914111|nr:GNAT family N-acetyltransferase [Herbiconiux sp. SALV-R1]QJU52301.1 GNAT family N-acetyltransferase [Herbiconiux sp. SALV-R1]WPO87149.1 GNAT family N-acetyltransferase [Herbiconiux sp. KACC 21604]
MIEISVSDARRALRAAKDALASAGVRRPRVLRGERTEHPFDACELRTERLVLRPHRTTARDVDDWFELQAQPSVTEFLPWPQRDRRQSARHLRDRTRHVRLWQADDFLALAVELEGRLIGDVSLHLRKVARAERSLEMGWVLHPGHGGRGYATEAARAMHDLAFERLEAREVTAVTDARNRRSVALATRLGFVERSRLDGAVEFALDRKTWGEVRREECERDRKRPLPVELRTAQETSRPAGRERRAA